MPNSKSLIPRQSLTPGPESLPPAILRMKLVGANPAAKVSGTDELPGKSNYFIGNDPKKWRTNVPNYARVKYQDVYAGIDLVYYGNQQQLEYDFVVAPGGDPKAIALEIETRNPKLEIRNPKLETRSDRTVAPVSSSRERDDGDIAATKPRGADTAEGVAAGLSRQHQDGGLKPPLRIDPNGDLVIATEAGEVRFHKPVVYQPVEAPFRAAPAGLKPGATAAANPKSKITNPKSVDGRYILLADNRVGFEVGAYDKSLPLIIDPVLSYSTFLGGSNEDYAYGIAVDASGSAYVAGWTASTDFPTTSGGFQTVYGGGAYDTFVTKLNPAGDTLVYLTYLGGSADDYGKGIAVDASGNAYVTGYTYSSNFPTTPGAFQTGYGGGGDAFVTKLNAAGSSFLYSTYLGGSNFDYATAIAVDAAGNAYVAGLSYGDFPTTPGAFQPSYGGSDAFVTKVNGDGSALVYSTYLGGSTYDDARGIAVDTDGSAYVTGNTNSIDFPITPDAFQTSFGGPENATDAFVTKVNADGSALVYSTYLGGSNYDEAHGIAVDTSGNAYVTGLTFSGNFPTTRGAFQTGYGGGGDAFVTKLKADGSALVYSTYLGGSNDDSALSIAVDATGNAYVSGYTTSSNFPTTPGAFQTSFGGGPFDAFVAKIALEPITSVFLHGSGAIANPAALFLDAVSPPSMTAKYNDSAGVKFSGGNPWQRIGTWSAAPALTSGSLASLRELHTWVGLKNSDDQGTRFDLRAEVRKNGVPVAAGETFCITGATRNPSPAKGVTVPFAPFAAVPFNGRSDGLSLVVFTRIGTDGLGNFCGGHSNAVGLRLYFDTLSQPSSFGVRF